MPKVAIVGAGSLVFTRTLVTDLLQHDATDGSEIRLVDIDANRLELARRSVEALVARAKKPATVVATLDTPAGLRGCDYVVNTVQVGGKEATRLDFEIPERSGVRQTIADTHGIGGISRAMRTLPAVLDIARCVCDYAPRAMFLNYTNPMAMVIMAIDRAVGLPHIGLCHGTEHTVSAVAGYLDVPREMLRWSAAGINHMTWLLELSCEGVDLYPRLRELANDANLACHEDAVRLELLRRFGYFVSESSVHNAEYYPWFLRPGVPTPCGVRVREYLYRLQALEESFSAEVDAISRGEPPPLAHRSDEYAPRLIAALETGTPYGFMGNTVNTKALISNLPRACCVEVPCFVNSSGVVAGAVGDLPEQCAALNRSAVNVQLLTVEAILSRSLDKLHQAALLDPLLSAQLSIDEIVALVDSLVEAHGNPAKLK